MALVVSVPIPLRTQLVRTAQEVRGTSDLRGPEWNVEPRDAKLFYKITETKKPPTNTSPKTVSIPTLTFDTIPIKIVLMKIATEI